MYVHISFANASVDKSSCGNTYKLPHWKQQTCARKSQIHIQQITANKIN